MVNFLGGVMPDYKYQAQKEDGKIVNGVMAANDEQDLHERLKAMGFSLIEATEATAKVTWKPLKMKSLAEYSRQIGTLLKSGVSLVRALRIISEDESIGLYERSVYTQVLQYVLQGIPLSNAMENMGNVFPPLIINMFRAAETSGTLDRTALKMADQYTKDDRLNSKIKSSMTYPKILSALIVVVVAIIFGFVMPQFKSLFDQMTSLPLPTRVMMAISSFVQKKWYVLVIAAVAIYLFFRFLFKIPQVVFGWDKLLVHMPKIGKLMKVIYTARFARTLSSLYSSGIPIVTSLEIGRKTIGNRYIDKQFDDVISKVKAGENLSTSLEPVDGFVKKMTASIRVGEETGSLDTMLNSTADDLDFESERAINQMVAYIEPIMIVIMAVIVGFIMISVIQPIYESYQQIGGGDM